MSLRSQRTLDGGPYETLKESAIAMLGPASLDESMESVMVESTVGLAKFAFRLIEILIIIKNSTSNGNNNSANNLIFTDQ